jgi:hypothetical protein
VMGKEIMRQQTTVSETQIFTENLLPGFYILNCDDGNKATNFRIVKF